MTNQAIPTSAQIIKGLAIIDQVLTYGVDTVDAELFRPRSSAQVDITRENFFSEIYVHRRKDEEAIMSQVSTGSLAVIIVGDIGSGKSTLLHNVLYENSKQTTVPPIVVDFNYINTTLRSLDDVDVYLRYSAKRQAIAHIAKQIRKNYASNVTDEELFSEAATILTKVICSAPESVPLSTECDSYVSTLRSHYRFSTEKIDGITFTDWLDQVLGNAEHVSRTKIVEAIQNAETSMRLVDVLYGLAEWCRQIKGDKIRHKCVLALDNLDAIPDISTRDVVIEWLKSRANASQSVKIVGCIRPQNLQHLRDHDKQNSKSTVFWGDDATHVWKYVLNEPVLDEAQIAEWREKIDNVRKTDAEFENDAEEESSEVFSHVAYEELIQFKRIDYAARFAESGRISQVDRADLIAVSKAAAEVTRVASISKDLRLLSNRNRRVMLAGIVNFLEYVALLRSVEWSDIGGTQIANTKTRLRVRRNLALRSLYYQFLGSSAELGGQPPVFSHKVFDPVGDVIRCGWAGRKLNAQPSEIAQACQNTLVVLGIYNASGNTIGLHSDLHAKVSSVVECCNHFGLGKETVVNQMLSMLRERHRFSSMFEIDHFVAIVGEGRPIEIGDRIVATPRCHRMLSHSSFMAGYLCERLKENGVTCRDFANNELLRMGIPDLGLLSELPSWLAKMLLVECYWVESLNTHARHGKGKVQNAFDQYCRLFLIKKSHATRMLWTHQMTLSCAAFVSRDVRVILDNLSSQTRAEVIRVCGGVEDRLNRLAEYCERVSNNLKLGSAWGIPRNEAVDLFL